MVVMIFIFYNIVASFLFCVLEINCFIVNNENVIDVNDINPSVNDSQLVTESGSVMAKHMSLLYIIQNPSAATNLKSNIFDKMLSNEMLSIQQQLYVKNETNEPPIYLTFKNSIATPTLELKQRWSIEKLSPHTDIIQYEKENINLKSLTYTNNDYSDLSTHKINKNDYDDKVKHKVLGVRSFAAIPRNLESSNKHQNLKHQCTCMKNNPHTICGSKCTQHGIKTCTQIENVITVQPQCTRNVMPLTYYPYYIYSTMFLGVTSDPSIVYYYPGVMNELKLPKHKHTQNKKPAIDNLYIEDKYDNDYLEYENSDEETLKKIKYPKNKGGKGKTKRPKNTKMVYFVDYKEGSSMSEAREINDGYLQVLNRDKFIEDVVEDLKVFYSDAVIKDCYCSLSSFKFRNKILFIYVAMFITFIM